MDKEENAPLVSIIVPVYNVKPYLRQCLESVINQSYSKLDILVIDDGSTDGCGEICDEYGVRDERIRVFHTENQGLSAARNLGLDNMTGEFIAFLDSDDWFELNAIEVSLRAALNHCADLVIFRSRNDGNIQSQTLYEEDAGFMSKDKAIRTLFHGWNFVVWNKLYHRKLIGSIRFIPEKLFEDQPFTVEVLNKAHQIYYICQHLYNYRNREGSITKQQTIKAATDRIEMKRLAANRMEEIGYHFEAERYRAQVSWSYRTQHGRFSSHADQCVQELLKMQTPPDWFGWRARVMWRLMYISPLVFDIACVLFGKRKK